MSFRRLFSTAGRFAYTISKGAVMYAIPIACTCHTAFHYIGEISPSYGPSMLPTLNVNGDSLIVSRLGNWRNKLRTGDVIVYISPTDPHRRAVKRILGMSGDTVCVDPTKDELEYVQVPKGYVWVQGDNHSCSTDSRTYGPIPLALLCGRVLACAWPEPRLIRNTMEVVPGQFNKQV